uniref:Uncharacterized protein n=1 Tax=Cacopsylla melanoneura TaxID=428564 RepID=A0A8D8YP95_9HEMI
MFITYLTKNKIFFSMPLVMFNQCFFLSTFESVYLCRNKTRGVGIPDLAYNFNDTLIDCPSPPPFFFPIEQEKFSSEKPIHSCYTPFTCVSIISESVILIVPSQSLDHIAGIWMYGAVYSTRPQPPYWPGTPPAPTPNTLYIPSHLNTRK